MNQKVVPPTIKSKQVVPPHPKYRNIIFDLGGVLVSWKPKEIIASVFKGTPEIPWHLESVIRAPEWLELDRGTKTFKEVLFQVTKRFPFTNIQEDCIKFHQAVPSYLTQLTEGLEILHAVQAKGFATFILSNLSEPAYNTISEYDFFKTVQGGIYSYQVKSVKPDPDIYHLLLDTYKLKAEECLFIDDLEVNIQGAGALNIDGIVCNDHAYVREELRKRGVIG